MKMFTGQKFPVHHCVSAVSTSRQTVYAGLEQLVGEESADSSNRMSEFVRQTETTQTSPSSASQSFN